MNLKANKNREAIQEKSLILPGGDLSIHMQESPSYLGEENI